MPGPRRRPSHLRVVVAGAGIAGLTAALSLHAAGITDVTVHEAVEELHPLGVGINILPHAVRELVELGLGDRLAAIGVPTADLTFLTPRGQRIWSEPRGLDAGYRWPQYSIHRGRLQMMLPFMTGRSMIMVGDTTRKLVVYPVAPPGADGTQLINWAVQRAADVEGMPWGDWNRPIGVEKVLPHVEGWHCDELDISALVAGAVRVFEYPLVDRDPLPRWSTDTVTLMGDAAHPMYPTGSNGGTQAIIDARVLAYALATGLGLDFYEDQRRPVTNDVVLANRKDGPEIVLRLAHERAPQGFTDIEQVMPLAEREEIALRYKKLAGFEPATLNARRSWSVLPGQPAP